MIIYKDLKLSDLQANGELAQSVQSLTPVQEARILSRLGETFFF